MSEFSDLPVIRDPEESRCACLLLLDASSSMSGEPITLLNRGVRQFIQELNDDPLASKRVEVAVMSFGEGVSLISDFDTARDFRHTDIVPGGLTPMAAALLEGTKLVEARKQAYRANGITYYRPWIFMITDGEPTDANTPQWQEAISTVADGEETKKFALFSVGVEGANFDRLNEVSVRTPLKLRGLQFSKMFLWLSRSLGEVSRSKPGDEVPMENPTDGVSGWATAPL